jgi:hypothetical protein
MGYGYSSFGFGFYGLSEYDFYSTYSLNASAKIASRLGPTTIFATAAVSSRLGPLAINAAGFVGERTGPSAINASANVALRMAAHAINAGANIGERKAAYEIYASGKIQGTTVWAINAGGLISTRPAAKAINASANVAIVRQNYVNATGVVALKRTTSINASGLIIGYVAYAINASGVVGERTGPLAINASANMAARASVQIFASSKVATRPAAYSINTSGTVALRTIGSINASAKVGLRTGPSAINASAKVAERLGPSAINASAKVAAKIVSTINADCHIGEPAFASINASAHLAPPAGSTQITASGLIMASPYYYLNGIDITNLMLEGLKPRGPDRKISKKQYPGQEKVLLSDDGYDIKEYSFDTLHPNQQAAFDYIEDAMNASGNMRFYPGDSLWFHKAKFVQIERSRRRGTYYFALSNTVMMAKPWLYLDLTTSWITGAVNLPRTSTDILNSGHYDTPLESLKITGHYVAGYPLGITYAIMNGVNQISIITLADKILSEEILELDEDGILKSTYTDDFASATRFTNDTVRSGATLAGGKVTVASGGYFYYRFRGPWPCIENISLLSKINIIAGSPVIEVSNDAMATWTTAVAATDIGNNVSKTYYMVGSDHYSDIYIRFRAPTGTSFEVEDISFIAQRRTTGTATPTIAAGATRQVKISDGAGSTHNVSIEAVFRERRRAI